MIEILWERVCEVKGNLLEKKEKLLEKIDLPKEVMLDLPKITVIGDREISIENHKGIESFDNDYIKIKTKKGVVKVEGNNLEILYIADETIVVSGKFLGISYGDLEK